MANCKYKDDKERKAAKNRQNQAWYRRKRAKMMEKVADAGRRSRSSGDGAGFDLDARLALIRRRCAASGYDAPVHALLASFAAEAAEGMLCEGNAILDDVRGLVGEGLEGLERRWGELMEISMKVHWVMAVLQVRLDIVRSGEGVPCWEH